MLKMKENRFYYGGISFPFPNGLCIVTDTDIVYENGLLFKPEDERFSLLLDFYKYEDTPQDYLSSILKPMIKTKIYEPINKIEINGLRGVQTMYGTSSQNYYEAHFEPASKNSDIHLSILIATNKDEMTIDDVLNKKEVKNLISDIQVES